MPWLARLDARAQQWPLFFRWPFLALRWLLILIGVYLVIGLAFRETSQRRVGLGIGVLLAVLFGLIGVVRRKSSPPSSTP